MTHRLVEAQELRVGDKLCSGGVVTNRPYVDINTPIGKVNLGVNGYLKVWNKRTKIAIVDERIATTFESLQGY